MPGTERPMAESPAPAIQPELTPAGRWLVLVTAFLGWFGAGMLMNTTQLVALPAATALLGGIGELDRDEFQALSREAERGGSLNEVQKEQLTSWKALTQRWWAFYQCAFLFGAAAGGFVLGGLGDWIGRSKAMAVSILCYSVLSAAATLAVTPSQFLVVWFLACMGVGGMWPNGVALLSETWSGLSKPTVAGIMGTSANVGIFALATVATNVQVRPDQWRWMLFVDASAMLLGLFVLAAVPESPRWLAARHQRKTDPAPTAAAFSLSLVPIILLGIVLATVPLVGGWGNANWMNPWAAQAGPALPPKVQQWRSMTGLVGSLLGGWVAHLFGRRLSYCLVSLAALFCSLWIFGMLVPTDPSFLFWVGALGFFSGIYFGWLPLFLPELFPTAARSTGSGVSFNSGRILTGVLLFLTGVLTTFFAGDYARIGRVTSLCFAVGALAIWLAPDTTRRLLKD